jgi:hypothetical protein
VCNFGRTEITKVLSETNSKEEEGEIKFHRKTKDGI